MISNIDLSRCSKGFLGRYARRYPNQPFDPVRWASLPPIEPTEEEVIEKPVISKRDESAQLKGQVIYLQNKLNSHLDKKPGKYKYK